MEIAQALAWFSNLLRHDRLPHAVLLLGEESANETLAQRASELLLETSPESSPDWSWEVVPEAGDDEKLGATELRDRIHASLQLRPVGKRRVFVLLGIERLSPEARDALLKPLEEPPPATVMLLGAPDASAVSETIRSRCRILRVASAAESADSGMTALVQKLDTNGSRLAPGAWCEEILGTKRGDLSTRREKTRAFLEAWVGAQRAQWRSQRGIRAIEAEKRALLALTAIEDLRRQVTPELALSGLAFSLAGKENFAR